MANPLFNMFGQSPMGDMTQMIQQFKEFKANFKGDPRSEVEKLIQSGRISQDQLNQAQQMARQLQGLLK